MLLLPISVLAAVLARAVSATSILPGLAYDDAFITAGQTVMTMHVPTYSGPSIMLPSLQGSERRLFKRAPIPEVATEEDVPLLSKPRPRKSFFSIHGQHYPDGTITDEQAAKPVPSFSELIDMRKEGGGDPIKDHTLAFHEERTMEKHLHSPLRKAKLIGSHLLQSLKGYIVKVFNRKKGNEILDRTNRTFASRYDGEGTLHGDKMNAIHRKFNAREPVHQDVPAPRRTSSFPKERH